MRYGGYGFQWRPYVSAATRRARAQREVKALRKKGADIQPIDIEGRTIAHSFWGAAWCKHLEKFSDFANRLPRGRTYVRNGSVCHLEIKAGVISALVSGSEMYHVLIEIAPLPRQKWSQITRRCAGRIGSLVELLQGRLSAGVMEVVTDTREGLFPAPQEIKMHCDCPDWAVMCKHVAAVLYGVGARLDDCPELLFLLRGVDHGELISAGAASVATVAAGRGAGRRIASDDLEDVFGIELSDNAEEAAGPRATAARKGAARGRRPARRNGGAATAAGRRRNAAARAMRGAAPSSRESARSARKAGAPRQTGSPRLAEPPREAATTPPPASVPEKVFTGTDVAELRAALGLSKIRFAALLGVSAPSIANWENHDGVIKLQERTRRALGRVALQSAAKTRGTSKRKETAKP